MDEILSFENIIKLFLSLRQVEIFSRRWMTTSALVIVMNQVYNLDDSGLTLTSEILNGALTSRRKELKSIFIDHLNFCLPGMIGRTAHYKWNRGELECFFCLSSSAAVLFVRQFWRQRKRVGPGVVKRGRGSG